MSQSFIKWRSAGSHSALTGLGVLASEQLHPDCMVCGTPYMRHGSYPTCASHPYTPDGNCQHAGTFAGGSFIGAPCAGAECRNGCVRGRAPATDGGQR